MIPQWAFLLIFIFMLLYSVLHPNPWTETITMFLLGFLLASSGKK